MISNWEFKFGPIWPEKMVRVYGVSFAVLDTPDGGRLYLTAPGWAVRELLQPEHWFTKRRYRKVGSRLEGGTGAVYRVPVNTDNGRSTELVVKFTRFAQHVPLDIPEFFFDDLTLEEKGSAHFNDPFEEMAAVMELRRGDYGPPDLRVRTQRPLGIYSPSGTLPLWKSGRQKGDFFFYRERIENDQKLVEKLEPVELDLERDYVCLYQYLRGVDGLQALERGLLEEEEVRALTRRSIREMSAKGFRVLDNKPQHHILRQDRHGEILRDHNGKLVYALIDFELLQRTASYESWLRMNLDTGLF